MIWNLQHTKSITYNQTLQKSSFSQRQAKQLDQKFKFFNQLWSWDIKEMYKSNSILAHSTLNLKRKKNLKWIRF